MTSSLPPSSDEHVVRAALDDAVGDLEPTDRLAEIRSRTSATSRRGWYAAGGSVLLAAAAVVTVAVVATPGGTATVDPAAPRTAPTASASPGPVAPDAPPAGGPRTTARPVYYVGETPDGPALYREYRQLDERETGDVVRLATTPDSALDPDYRTAWPEPLDRFSVDGFGVDGSYGVPIPADLVARPDGVSEVEATLAVQQVIYTVQALGSVDSEVVFYVDGETADSVLGVPTADGVVARAPQLDVLADVNVFDPVEGLRVQGSFTARGVANSFEATVGWEIRDGSGAVVDTYSTTAESGAGDRLYPWETEIDVSDLEPGVYTFIARTDDPSVEPPGPTEDTRTIVVEEPDATPPPTSTTTAYFVGPGPDGPDAPADVLYRTTASGGANVLDALEAGPTDPDYRTLWPAGSFRGASDPEAGMMFVDLRDASLGTRPPGMTPEEAALAVEQVLWSVQGLDYQPTAVQFRVDGNPTATVLGVPTSEPLVPGEELTVLSHMLIDTPLEGAGVRGSFTASGAANGYEGTVFCQLLDAAGKPAWQEATINGGLLDETLNPWELEVDLRGVEPGDYTLRCQTDDPTAGTEGRGADADTRTITVEQP